MIGQLAENLRPLQEDGNTPRQRGRGGGPVGESVSGLSCAPVRQGRRTMFNIALAETEVLPDVPG